MAINALPGIGDTVMDGQVTVLDMKEGRAYDQILIFGHWATNPITPYATWLYDPANGALYSGHYFAIRDAAEADFITR